VPDKGKFDLGDYVEVKDRIRVFYESYGQGRLVTSGYELTREPDDKPKVIVTALAYRSPEDPHPGVGTSWMYLPGKTSYTAGSEIENVETSAWGRAIGSLGILIDRSIATSTEIDAKAGEAGPAMADPARAAVRSDEPELVGSWSGSGAIGITKNGTADGFLRQSPEGPVVIVNFTTTDERKVSQVVFRGGLAMDFLDAAGSDIKGLICTLEGEMYRVPYYVGEPKVRREFDRLEVARITTAAWSLPIPMEPDSVPLFDETELDALPALA
jgi:hypothetical protein